MGRLEMRLSSEAGGWPLQGPVAQTEATCCAAWHGRFAAEEIKLILGGGDDEGVSDLMSAQHEAWLQGCSRSQFAVSEYHLLRSWIKLQLQ